MLENLTWRSWNDVCNCTASRSFRGWLNQTILVLMCLHNEPTMDLLMENLCSSAASANVKLRMRRSTDDVLGPDPKTLSWTPHTDGPNVLGRHFRLRGLLR